jgi:magnesium chelatase subunit H
MKITVLYVGSSLPAALRRAERDINAKHGIGLTIALHNCTLPLDESQFEQVERDLTEARIVFIIHVTDAENAARICAALNRIRSADRAVIVLSCLRDLMQHTRMRSLNFASLFGGSGAPDEAHTARRTTLRLWSWLWRYVSSRRPASKSRRSDEYLRFVSQAPAVLRFLPARGAIGDVKHYLTLYCYFLQPTPSNIRALVLYAIKHFATDRASKSIRIDPPENRPATGIYHPDATALFNSFGEYRRWYEQRPAAGPAGAKLLLDPGETAGLLLMRPQIVSGAHRHYDALIRALESEGVPVLPVLSTFMDNRQACQAFFVDPSEQAPRVSQIVSLTGFSFVGGPAMNDSEAAVAFLKGLNRPFRAAVNLEMQRTEDWSASMIGLNPVQTAMQVAIPEIDGATEPFVYSGTATARDEPEALPDRCARIAARISRWNRLRGLPRAEVRVAIVVYCFPPNKGNLGTAADLDVFPSLWELLQRLRSDGYWIEAPATPELLRDALLGTGNGVACDHFANVAYRLSANEYYRLCPHVEEIEAEWGPAPGQIGSEGSDILIHGLQLGNAFVAIQPTFGYEGDPMKMLMAQGGTPHHGFMGLYTYLQKIYRADALVHFGTHGALEFMPGKQVGLSGRCWPDRLIGELPNIYVYSVNNPSEGSIAKRRSYAELISYLTPPIESAGLYKELAALKELIGAYRQSRDEHAREQLYDAIEEKGQQLNMSVQ